MGTMKWVCLALLLSPSLVLGATYTETREVVDSDGKTFECAYTVFYTAKGVVNKAKSKVVCTPNTAGKPVEQTFIIEEIGQSVTLKHSIKQGRICSPHHNLCTTSRRNNGLHLQDADRQSSR